MQPATRKLLSIPEVALQRTLRGHSSPIFSLSWSRDGRKLAASAFDGTVRIWDTESAQEPLILPLDGGSAFCTAWSPDGTKLATGDTGKRLQIWDAESGSRLMVRRNQNSVIHSLDWSPDGQRLASGSYQGTVYCWDARTGEVLETLNPGSDPVRKVAWSRDGRILAAGLRQITLWDFEARTSLPLEQKGPAEDLDLRWSRGGSLLVSASREGIFLWNARDLSPVWSGDSQEHWYNSAVSVAADERFLATLSLFHELRFWRVPDLSCVAVLRMTGSNENRLSFHPSLPLLALTDCEDGHEVELWRIDYDALQARAALAGGPVKAELRDRSELASGEPAEPDVQTLFTTGIPAAAATASPETKLFDVFLCHNVIDKPTVREIAGKLKERNLEPWFDEWELRPGLPWQPALEGAIKRIKSAAVFVGKAGLGPWQQQELQFFLDEFKRRSCPVIPVLLPDAPAVPSLPDSLSQMTWVDFRKSEPDPLARLIWGITGLRYD
jgi:hypothetical protein